MRDKLASKAPPGTIYDPYSKHFILDEVLLSVYNMQNKTVKSGYTIMSWDKNEESKIVADTLDKISYPGILLNVEYRGIGKPDFAVSAQSCSTINNNGIYKVVHNTSGRNVLGFEHFAIGSMYGTNKQGNNRLKTYEYLEQSVYKDASLKPKVLNKKIIKELRELANIRGTYSDLLESFKTSYERHYRKVKEYVKNVEYIAKDANINTEVCEKSIWFIVENIDSLLIQKNNAEIPLVITDRAINIMHSIQKTYQGKEKVTDIGGIVYIGLTGVFIISGEALNYQFEKYSCKPDECATIGSPMLEVELSNMGDLGDVLVYSTVIGVPWSRDLYGRITRLEIMDSTKILSNNN